MIQRSTSLMAPEASRHCSQSFCIRHVRPPVVGLIFLFVKLVGPIVLERQDVEKHGLLAIDHALGVIRFLGLAAVENEGLLSDFVGGWFSVVAGMMLV